MDKLYSIFELPYLFTSCYLHNYTIVSIFTSYFISKKLLNNNANDL